MDDNTRREERETSRERAERILKKQIRELDLMLEFVGMPFPAECWDYLSENITLSLASEVLPELEELLDEPEPSKKKIGNLAEVIAEYKEGFAFYTHPHNPLFPQMTIHLGLKSEEAPDDRLRCSISCELAHAFSYFIVEDIRGLRFSLPVAEFYETAFSWWTDLSPDGPIELSYMKTSYLYKECVQHGKVLMEAAEDAVYLSTLDPTSNPQEFEEKVQATLVDFERFNRTYPINSSGTHDSHIIGNWMCWLLLEEISKHINRPPEDCTIYLAQVAAKALGGAGQFLSPEGYLEEMLTRLPDYLTPKTS